MKHEILVTNWKPVYNSIQQWVHHVNCKNTSTVEPVLKDHPVDHKNMVSQDRWSLVTGSFTLKYVTFCKTQVALQDRWSLMAVVSQDRFHCSKTCEVLTSTNALMVTDLRHTICTRYMGIHLHQHQHTAGTHSVTDVIKIFSLLSYPCTCLPQ